jgi:hypothetical protein
VASAVLVVMGLRDRDLGAARLVCLLPLFLVVRMLRPLAGLFCGALWGSYIYLGLVLHGTGGAATAWPPLVLLPALYVGVAAWFTARFGFRPLLLAAGWLAAEWGLHIATGEDGFVAVARRHSGLLGFVAEQLGWLGLSLFIAWINAGLAALPGRFGPGARGRRLAETGTDGRPPAPAADPLRPAPFLLDVSRPRAPPHSPGERLPMDSGDPAPGPEAVIASTDPATSGSMETTLRYHGDMR